VTKKKATPIKQGTPKKATKAVEASHPLLHAVFRGHQDDITAIDVTIDAKVVVSCSRDRTMRLWRIDSDKNNPIYTRIAIDLNYGTACSFSKEKESQIYLAVALGIGRTKTVQIYGLTKGKKLDLKLLHQFETTHRDDINMISFGKSNSFILTSTSSNDTVVNFWSPKGELIRAISTNQMRNHSLAVSYDRRFFTFATMMGNGKIFEVINNKENKGLERIDAVFTLEGHRRGLNGIGFGPSNETIATTSLDGSWRLWNTNIRYKDGEDPKILLQEKLCEDKSDSPLGLVGLSPTFSKKKGVIAAVIQGTNLRFYHCVAKEQTVLSVVENVHREFVNSLYFTSNGEFLVTSGGDKSVKVWKIPPLTDAI